MNLSHTVTIITKMQKILTNWPSFRQLQEALIPRSLLTWNKHA